MCGRYTLTPNLSLLQGRFGFEAFSLSHAPRYNIAPTEPVLTVVNSGVQHQARFMRWGLIPFWARDRSIGNRMINARAETVAEKPSFRRSLERRRCLIPADGFYEWRREGKRGVPMRIGLRSWEPFAFAGLWERWRSPENELVYSCAIITMQANALVKTIHPRMPVILSREAEDLWLDPGLSDVGRLRDLLVPYSEADMEAYEVATLVNSPQNDMPDVIARVG